MDVQRIIAIDPGRVKCGLAVLDNAVVRWQGIVTSQDVVDCVKREYTEKSHIVVGDRTGSKDFIRELKKKFSHISGSIVLVDEHLSSVQARERYWQANPRRGWRRLIPVSLQVPPEPIDDIVAVILAERFLKDKTRSN